jgi:maltose/moltooligosaccharide transporter
VLPICTGEHVISKPHLSAWQICSICIGAFGIQFGFALPQANATRIFQNLGATLDSVPLLFLAGPITGLIVQPLVGYYSDRTWTRYGRRRPYFLVGAALAAATLVAMPNATTLWMAVLTLWILDASLNLTMGPFRAFVADQLPAVQRSTGYVTYMFFASVGAVIGSLLPWAFAVLGASSLAPAGEISVAVKMGFAVGAALLLSAVCWSAFSTREYPPEMLERFDGPPVEPNVATSPARMHRHAFVWLALGGFGLVGAWASEVRAALFVLVCASLVYGVFLLMASRMKSENAFTTILGELESMSASMRWLAVVQFCSWFTLFAVFVYTTPAVARMHFGDSSPGSAGYEAGANWVGVLFATYNGLGAVAALIIPFFVRRFGLRSVHRVNLWIGAAGLLSMMVIRDADWLLVSMIGLGFAWASIISLPYAMLANSLPSRKMGVNIGIFNIFIVIPQLLAASVLPLMLEVFADGDPSGALVIGAVGWFLAGWAVMRVKDTASREVAAI